MHVRTFYALVKLKIIGVFTQDRRSIMLDEYSMTKSVGIIYVKKKTRKKTHTVFCDLLIKILINKGVRSVIYVVLFILISHTPMKDSCA